MPSQFLRTMIRSLLFIFTIGMASIATPTLQAAEPDVLPNTKQLMPQKMSLDKRMVAGIDKFATRALQEARDARLKTWLHDFNTLEHGAFQKKMAAKRERLKTIIGVVDERVKPKEFVTYQHLGYLSNNIKTGGWRFPNNRSASGEDALVIALVRWKTLNGVTAEGVLLTQDEFSFNNPRQARVIVIPDAAWTPEQLIGCNRFREKDVLEGGWGGSLDFTPKKKRTKDDIKKAKNEEIKIKNVGVTMQLAIELATQGCEVIIPLIINRESTHSGHPDVFYTNIPHREWIYRMSFQMGRHIIGYEVQKVLAAVDLFELENKNLDTLFPFLTTASKNDLELKKKIKPLPIGVVGIGEGGQIALLAGAIDSRIHSTMICGYFNQREKVYNEPIYRNIWSQLTEFGDAEIAAMIAPRTLTIEACSAPEISGPPVATKGRRANAALGVIKTPELTSVQIEFNRAETYFKKLGYNKKISLAISLKGNGPAGSKPALQHFLKGLGIELVKLKGIGWKQLNHVFNYIREKKDTKPGHSTFWGRTDIQESEELLPAARQHRQFKELTIFTQNLLRTSAKKRDQFWKKADRTSLESWKKTSQWYRNYIHEELFGKLPEPTMPLNPKSRKVIDVETHTGYEVTIDVYPDIFAGGILLLPKGIKKGEKRAVVVCQHGLEGRSVDTITTDTKSRPYRSYKGFATQLVKLGYIVYAPQNPYIGKDRFRILQRKSNPLKRSLYSYIIPQHQQTLKWLATLPNVDAKRIAFYGLSYGGKTAVRVPPFLPPKKDQPGYCLSICSGDFNEWIKKCVSDEDKQSYLFHGEYEMWEWNMGHVANYAELSTLMTPRPFMVERGHNDGVAPDEWVAWEYSKVRKHYDQIGIGDKTEIEWFNGPHTINGKGTFKFLHKHLKAK